MDSILFIKFFFEITINMVLINPGYRTEEKMPNKATCVLKYDNNSQSTCFCFCLDYKARLK